MTTLTERIVALIGSTPGLTDHEVAERLFGPGTPRHAVNQAARLLASRGQLSRRHREDGRIGNYPGDGLSPAPAPDDPSDEMEYDPQSEDDLKRKLKSWLEAKGWTVKVVWGRTRGIDIDAKHDDVRWVIEVKGRGSRDAMRVNYFLMSLGETLQRMNDPRARYSIALPDTAQFKGLWGRLPQIAKYRTQISALFVSDSGKVAEVE